MIVLSTELQRVLECIAKYSYSSRERRDGSTISNFDDDDRNAELLLKAEIEDPDTIFYYHQTESKEFRSPNMYHEQKIKELTMFLQRTSSNQ